MTKFFSRSLVAAALLSAGAMSMASTLYSYNDFTFDADYFYHDLFTGSMRFVPDSPADIDATGHWATVSSGSWANAFGDATYNPVPFTTATNPQIFPFMLRGPRTHFAWQNAPFPSSGPFTLEFSLKFPQLHISGVGVCARSAGTYTYDPGTGVDTYSENEPVVGPTHKNGLGNNSFLTVWGDYPSGGSPQITVRSQVGAQSTTITSGVNDWIIYKLDCTGPVSGVYTYTVSYATSSIFSFTTAFTYTSTLYPNTLWMGNPLNTTWSSLTQGDWSRMQVDYLRIVN